MRVRFLKRFMKRRVKKLMKIQSGFLALATWMMLQHKNCEFSLPRSSLRSSSKDLIKGTKEGPYQSPHRG